MMYDEDAFAIEADLLQKCGYCGKTLFECDTLHPADIARSLWGTYYQESALEGLRATFEDFVLYVELGHDIDIMNMPGDNRVGS